MTQNDKELDLAVKCSVFIASGGKSFTNILQSPPVANIDDFVYKFRDFRECIKPNMVPEKVLAKCEKLCFEFQIALKMYNKFDCVWDKLGVKDLQVQKACKDKLKKLTWHLYLHAKATCFTQEEVPDLPEYAILIVVVLDFMASNLNPSEVQCVQTENVRDFIIS